MEVLPYHRMSVVPPIFTMDGKTKHSNFINTVTVFFVNVGDHERHYVRKIYTIN